MGNKSVWRVRERGKLLDWYRWIGILKEQAGNERSERQINVKPSAFKQSFAQWPHIGDTRKVVGDQAVARFRLSRGQEGVDWSGYIT